MAVDTSIEWYLASWKDHPFEWMQADCWALAAGWLEKKGHGKRVKEITEALGNYEDVKGYLRRGKESGFLLSPSVLKAETTMFRVRTGLPQAGDVALVKPAEGLWIMGLVNTIGQVIMMTDDGPQRTLPVMDAAYFEVL